MLCVRCCTYTIGLHLGASDSTLSEAARAEIMCYNEDRSMTGFVSPTAKGRNISTSYSVRADYFFGKTGNARESENCQGKIGHFSGKKIAMENRSVLTAC